MTIDHIMKALRRVTDKSPIGGLALVKIKHGNDIYKVVSVDIQVELPEISAVVEVEPA